MHKFFPDSIKSVLKFVELTLYKQHNLLIAHPNFYQTKDFLCGAGSEILLKT